MCIDMNLSPLSLLENEHILMCALNNIQYISVRILNFKIFLRFIIDFETNLAI